MSLLKSLNQTGEKLSQLFGDSTEKLFSGNPLSEYLPYRAYDKESKLFVNENSFGFIVECTPLTGGDHTTQKEVSNLFLEVMEEGSSLQCLLWADPRVDFSLNHWSSAKKGELFETLAKKRVEFFKNKPKLAPRHFRTIFSYSEPFEGELTPSKIKKMQETKNRILKALNTLTSAFEWDADLFLSRLDGFVNFRSDCSSRGRKWNQYDFLSTQLPAGGQIFIDEDKLIFSHDEKTFFKSYRVVDFPDSWSLNEMERLIGDIFREAFRIKVPFLIHYGVHCPNQHKQQNSFWKKMQLVENQGKSGALLRWIPELAEELDECSTVRKGIKQGDRLMFSQMGAAIWSPEESFTASDQSIKSLFRVNQFTLESCDYLHLPHFLSFLPMTWAEYAPDLKQQGLLKTCLTTECGALVPFLGEWSGTRTSGTLLIGRRGQLLNWNPFDNQTGNYNVIVSGRSGSGKSVFMQDMLVNALGTGARIFVLEVGRSFEKMCDLVGGQSIAFSAESHLCLNPFTHISEIPEERDQAFSMLKSVISTMAAPTQGTDDYDNALIEKAIYHAWNAKKNQATITDVAEWLNSQSSEKANKIGVMLTPYSKGVLNSKYFEGINNVDFSSQMVLIELEELKEKKDLQAVVLQLFIMTITNITFLGDRKTPFYICIDEAWDLLRAKQTGVFIETLARRLRKYNGSLVIGTQGIDDFDATPGTQAALDNSDWTCLLSQKSSSIKSLETSGKINLNEYTKALLESVTTVHGEYGELSITDPQGRITIARLYLDKFSELLYSTKAEEYAQIKHLQKEGHTLVQAIETVQAGRHG